MLDGEGEGGGGSVGGLVNIVQPMIFGGTGGWGVGCMWWVDQNA